MILEQYLIKSRKKENNYGTDYYKFIDTRFI